MVVAKTHPTLTRLCELFKGREVKKQYRALLAGQIDVNRLRPPGLLSQIDHPTAGDEEGDVEVKIKEEDEGTEGGKSSFELNESSSGLENEPKRLKLAAQDSSSPPILEPQIRGVAEDPLPHPHLDGLVDAPVGGKSALTGVHIHSFTSIPQVTMSLIILSLQDQLLFQSAYGGITTVDLYPFTGRNHQLRRSLSPLCLSSSIACTLFLSILCSIMIGLIVSWVHDLLILDTVNGWAHRSWGIDNTGSATLISLP